MKAVTGKARKHAENGCAMVEDETVYSWIREYYGIAEEPKTDRGVFVLSAQTGAVHCLAEGFVVENIYLSILPTASISSEVSPAERK